MNAVDLFRGLARNNAWANHRLHDACGHLSHDALHTTRTSFFPTIMKTLNHILIVDWYYYDALAGEGRGRRTLEHEEPFDELAGLRDAQRTVDRKLITHVERLREADLDAPVRITRVDYIAIERAGDVLAHLFQHQIHHRGQVHAMLAGTSVVPPQLDEFFLAEDLPLRRAEMEELGLPQS